MKNIMKYSIMLLILVLIIILTLNSICDKASLNTIIYSIKNIDIFYILLALFIVSFYFVLQGIYMKIMLKTLNRSIPLFKGIFYSLVEFYFSGITPSSTGGQPVQLYYMTKDKIPVRNSYIILVLNTIYFKMILLFLGIIVLLFKSAYVISNDFIYLFFFVLGFLTDLIVVTLGFIFLFNKKLIRKMLTKLYSISKHFRILRKKLENKSIDNIMMKYNDELKFVKNNKKTIFITFIVTFLQRLSMFSIAYLMYRALGFNSYTYFDLLTIQVSVQLAIEMLPIPGGACLSESMLYSSFVLIFADSFAEVGMLLTRTFSFYIPLLMSGFIILIHTIVNRHKSNSY